MLLHLNKWVTLKKRDQEENTDNCVSERSDGLLE